MKKKNRKTVIMLLDAVREDYINEEVMPFLHKLKKDHTYLSMIPSIGYSNGAHSTIWSGLHQEQHNNFLIYFYHKGKSRFRNISRIFSMIPFNILRVYFIASLKLPYYKFKIIRRNPPKWYKETIIDYPPGMPPRIGKYISIGSNPEHKKTLFTILTENKIDWTTQTDIDNYYFRKSTPKNISKYNLTDKDVDFFYFYGGDGLAHVHGIESKELKEYLKNTDNKIRELLSGCEKGIDFFIFSDHGMINIKDFVDVKSILKKSKLKHGKDYIAFFDATMVRFWILDKRKEKQLLKTIKLIPKTTFMDENLIKKNHLKFSSRKWFDYMILMDPGVRPFPDYFVPLKHGIKAYHGYWPKHPESKGIFITNSLKTKKKQINIEDIMPTIAKAMKLAKYIPKDIDGIPVQISK